MGERLASQKKKMSWQSRKQNMQLKRDIMIKFNQYTIRKYRKGKYLKNRTSKITYQKAKYQENTKVQLAYKK